MLNFPKSLPGTWVPVLPEAKAHELASIEHCLIQKRTPKVFLGPMNRVGARYFLVYLTINETTLSTQPVLMGLHHTGPFPSHNWVEILGVNYRLEFEGENQSALTLRSSGYAQALGCVAKIIPPGGHLMVEYESPSHRKTERLLERGVPPILTPLGFLLFTIGCGHTIKNWYISEGWTEGPRKLQGSRALTNFHAFDQENALGKDILDYLVRYPHHKELLRKRALSLVPQLTAISDDIRLSIIRTVTNS